MVPVGDRAWNPLGVPVTILKSCAALAAATLLCACESDNTLKGNLTVSEPFTVKTVTGSVVTVPVKTFPTTLKMTSKGAEAWIHYPKAALVFAIPQVKEDKQGNISIPAAKLKQEFGIQGKIATKRNKFDQVVSESCVSSYNKETRCEWKDVCEEDADGNKNCTYQHVCEEHDIPVYGSQEVRQIGYQDVKVVDMSVVKAAKTVAKFQGTYHYRAKVTHTQEMSGCY